MDVELQIVHADPSSSLRLTVLGIVVILLVIGWLSERDIDSILICTLPMSAALTSVFFLLSHVAAARF